MPKHHNKTPYTQGATAEIFVHGIDDTSTWQQNKLKNIEAGSWLHGVIMARVPFLPPQPVALAKFAIKGKYLLHEKYITHSKDSEGHEHQHVRHDTSKESWLKLKTRDVSPFLPQVSNTAVPDHEGMYVLAFPFSYQVQDHWCDSFSMGRFAGCSYTLKLKVKFPSDPSGLKLKTERKIDIMQRRPTESEIHRRVKVESEGHMSLAGGSVQAAITINSAVFLEGTQVSFTAHIKNTMSRPIMSGKLELEEHIEVTEVEYNDKRHDKHYGKKRHSRDLLVSKLRGLEIAAESERTLVFSLDLPKIVEPPTTGFKQGKHVCKVMHLLKMRLNVPWGIDVTVDFPVTIAPNPARYSISQLPPPASIVSVQNADHALLEQVGFPPNYAPGMVVVLPPPPPWEYKGAIMFQLEVVNATGLPKMDTLSFRGGADPYCTLFINKLHVRTTEVVKNSRSPQFHQIFTFFLLDGYNMNSDPIDIDINVYDWDMATKDDKIGDSSISLSPQEVVPGSEFKMSLSLDHPKKGMLRNRGEVHFKVHGFGQLL